MQLPEIGFGQLKKDTPNGITFENGRRRLYLRDQVLAEGQLPGDFTPWDYFYNLRFLQDFPGITHWAFGDAWTQRLKITRPKRRGDQLEGWVFFGDEEQRGLYIIERAFDQYPLAQAPDEMRLPPPWVTTPLPPLFDVPLNIPLRLIVAKAVTAALDDDWPYDQWELVTSALAPEEVPQVFVTDIGIFGFRVRGLDTDLRRALCTLQGIRG